jgi:hypothetical protein
VVRRERRQVNIGKRRTKLGQCLPQTVASLPGTAVSPQQTGEPIAPCARSAAIVR